MRHWLVLGSLCVVVLVVTAAPGFVPPFVSAQQGDNEGSSSEDAADVIDWKKEEGAEKFREAQAAYKERRFKDAYKLFKKAESQARGKVSKMRVNRWTRAAKGGTELLRLEKVAQLSGKGQDALEQADRMLQQFRDTPIAAEYEKFLVELRERLFVVLEDFEGPTTRYNKKRGKEFVDDAKMVKEGTHAIRWEVVDDPAELKVKRLPENLEAFEAVAFWLHFPEKRGGKSFQLTFLGKGKSEKERASGKVRTNNGFTKQLPPHRGWKHIKVPLKTFSDFGEISWKDVEDFRIRFEGAKGLVVHVDDIVLIRR